MLTIVLKACHWVVICKNIIYLHNQEKSLVIINSRNQLLRINQHIHSRFPTNFDWVWAPSINYANTQSAVLGSSPVLCSLEVFVKLRPLNSPNLFCVVVSLTPLSSISLSYIQSLARRGLKSMLDYHGFWISWISSPPGVIWLIWLVRMSCGNFQNKKNSCCLPKPCGSFSNAGKCFFFSGR